MICVSRLDDITARHLAKVVESSDDAIISKSLDSIVTSWNQGAERIFGYKEEEMIGRSITAIIPPDRLDEEPQIVAEAGGGTAVGPEG